MLEKTIAVFGSAFNPPHCGHADVILQATAWADHIIVVPSYCHAFGKTMAPFEQRLVLAQALIDSMVWKKDVMVSDIEKTIAASQGEGHPIYTFDVLLALSAIYPDSKIVFVVGPDNASPEIWNTFYRADEILLRWGIWAAQERIHIRSTTIRNKLQQGDMPAPHECPAPVIRLLHGYSKNAGENNA